MTSYSTVVDRSFKRFASESSKELVYLHHPSGVTVCALNQDELKLTSPVVEVDFSNAKSKKGVQRGDQTVSGKGKKGGLQMQEATRICRVRCEDGREVVVRAGVRGTLVEVNDRLKDQPDLVRTAPENQGYIAIVTYGGGNRGGEGFGRQLPAKRVQLRRSRQEEQGEKEQEQEKEQSDEKVEKPAEKSAPAEEQMEQEQKTDEKVKQSAEKRAVKEEQKEEEPAEKKARVEEEKEK